MTARAVPRTRLARPGKTNAKLFYSSKAER